MATEPTGRERRILGYFRSITPGQQDAVEDILAKLNGERRKEIEQQPLPENVLAFRQKVS